jgi:hypothetical protein
VNRLEKTKIEKFPDLEKEKMQAEKEKRKIAREAIITKVRFFIIILKYK